MIARVTTWSGRHPHAVLLATALVAAGAYVTQRGLSRDVIPDLSDPQIGLVVEWMGHPASEVASEISAPLSRALDGVPGSTAVRGLSMSGMAYLDVVFDATPALARGRLEILARVEALRARLPAAARVQVGPEASTTGWVFQYALVPPDKGHAMPMAERAHEGDRALVPLRRFQEDVLRPALAAIAGVAEVATVGGERNERLIATTPDQLAGAGVAFSDVIAAARAHAHDAGGPNIAGPLGAIASVRVAPEMPSGVFDVDGRGSMVGGIVIARRGADVGAVIAQVKQVIDRERLGLPAGARLGVIYDRSELAGRVEQTLRRALAEEVAVVALVVLLFLLHGGSALVPMVTLPLVVLLTFAAMRLLGISATVMSLGGIAIALGMAVDADLVVLEACHRRLESAALGLTARDRRERIVAATADLAPAIVISLIIAALAFIPVFAFGGETGRLLRPLALTKTLVIAAAAIVALTVGPALRDWVLRGRIVPELGNPLTRGLVRIYRPFVHFALAWPGFTLATAALAIVSCVPILPRLGSEFLPRVDEGSLLFMPTTAPGVTDQDAASDLVEQDAALAERPEVAAVFGKVGRAETATDPAPFSMAETIVRLRPRATWPKIARRRWHSAWTPAGALAAIKGPLRWLWPEETTPTTAELVQILDHAARLPGWTSAWTAPVRARMDMMSTGVRTAVGVRVVAGDAGRLDALGAAVRAAVAPLPETRSASYERMDTETHLTFVLDDEALKRHDVEPAAARAVADLLLAGGEIGGAAGGAPRVRLTLDAPWLPKPPDDLLRDATVRAGADGGGQPVALGLLGRPVYRQVPAMARSERGESCAYVYIDVGSDQDVGVDLAGFVARARARVDQALGATLQAGERIEWTGQYQLVEAGMRRLKLIVPIVALSMLLLLCWQFRSLIEALIVLVTVPSALVGSFWTLYLLGYRLSAPVWVGLLSVVGLAMQTGVLMVVYIDEAFHRRVREGRLRTRADIVDAHAEGTVRRLRPKLMTIGTMAAALLPLLWSQGAGAEVMKRIAAPMLGGLVTSAFLTLEVIPVLYTIWRTRQLRAAERRGIPLAALIGTAATSSSAAANLARTSPAVEARAAR